MPVATNRSKTFQRNPNLEDLLKELNGLLNPIETTQILPKFQSPRYPVLFIVGAPRTGTTLTMQWLARTGEVGYPSNLLSRFYAAPYVGAKIQLLLTDPKYNYNDELLAFSGGGASFHSNLGKTQGPLEPNEFWYFWRRFIPNEAPRYITPEEESQVDGKGFVASLAALESAFDKPLAMKALILQYNIPLLASLLDNNVLFLYTQRHPVYNVQSLLGAREKYFGSREAWYSVKPKEYNTLKDLDPIEQVAGQIYYTNCAIEEGLRQLPPACSLEVPYDTLCQEPERLYRHIRQHLIQRGYEMDATYHGPQTFTNANALRLTTDEVGRVQDAWERFSGERPLL